MKFNLADDFLIEIGELEIKGYSKKITKKQEKEIKTKFKKDFDLIDEMVKTGKKLKRLEIENKINGEEDNQKLLQLSDKVDEINDELVKRESREKIAKYRFDISVESENMEDLIKLGQDYGYGTLLDVIGEAVRLGKQEEEKN